MPKIGHEVGSGIPVPLNLTDVKHLMREGGIGTV